MNSNPVEAQHQLERAEYHAAEAERALERAHRAVGEPLRSAVAIAQVDAQHVLRRIGTFLKHVAAGE